MRQNRRIILVCSLCVFGTLSLAQDASSPEFTLGEGLTIHAGLGYVAVRDEFISAEKYSGDFPYVALSWSRFHHTYGYRLGLQYQSTTRLKNYNISAEVSRFSLHLDYLYPVGSIPLLSKSIFFYLGPSSELFIHFRRQNIAGSGVSILNAYSFSSLISGGLKSEAFYPVNPAIQLEASARMSLVSLGGRMLNPNKSEESFVKLLSFLSGVNAIGEMKIRYSFTDSFSGTIGYRLEVTRISAWDYFLSSSDTFIVTIGYDF